MTHPQPSDEAKKAPSDTPRTDHNLQCMMNAGHGACINPEFSKQLERETAILTAQLAECAKEISDLLSGTNELATQLAEANRAIEVLSKNIAQKESMFLRIGHLCGVRPNEFIEESVGRMVARLAVANSKLDTILTDVNYEGGLQFWIKKHDTLLLELANAATQLAEAKETYTNQERQRWQNVSADFHRALEKNAELQNQLASQSAALVEKDAALEFIVTYWGMKEESIIDLFNRLKQTAAKALSTSSSRGWKPVEPIKQSLLKLRYTAVLNSRLELFRQIDEIIEELEK